MPQDLVQPLTQFGVAGLMGVLWVWERLMSRRREAQLDEAHDRVTRQGDEVGVLIELVRRNTVALERFEQTQRELRTLLEGMNHAMQKKG